MALITRSSPWPMFTHINWLLKSRNRLPSGVQKYTPFARATGIGSTAFCADHSKIVCRFDSATMSAPVIGPVIVLVIRYVLSPRSEERRVGNYMTSQRVVQDEGAGG